MDWADAGEAAWIAMVCGWYLVRWTFARRAKRAVLADNRLRFAERIRLTISLLGLGILPGIYVATGQPEFAAYEASPTAVVVGGVLALAALLLFRLTHKALGRNWSVSLQTKERHQLVTTGIYRYVRHPMYTAFWMMAFAQACLLPNWIAGFAGLLGFGILFFSRLPAEEQMMQDTFGIEYDAYRLRTKRVVPFVF